MVVDGPVREALRDVAKLVLVRSTNLGDIVTASPLLRALRAAFPRAELALIGRAQDRALVARYAGYIDRLIPFPGYPGLRECPTDARRTLAFLARMQAEEFDLALQVTGSGVFSNPFTTLLGARLTAGWLRPADDPRVMGLDIYAPYQPGRHQIQLMHDLLAALGLPPRGSRLEFPLWASDETELARALERAALPLDSPLIGVHPGARVSARRWPAARFAAAGSALARQHGGVLVVTGTERDAPATRAVVAAVDLPVVDLTGRLSLGALAALIARLTLLLVNDTGPAHLAYALGTPSVTIFGPSSPDEWGPLDRRRHQVVTPDRAEDIASIPVERVVAAGATLLVGRGTRCAATDVSRHGAGVRQGGIA
ncbi:MAG TPA: glycosyltransferase family 9 protein [Thermomicrobiaceae bacterium]|nr:glycosyltransferase family 9 protein [Thermomicrobiaceae bacterium]